MGKSPLLLTGGQSILLYGQHIIPNRGRVPAAGVGPDVSESGGGPMCFSGPPGYEDSLKEGACPPAKQD